MYATEAEAIGWLILAIGVVLWLGVSLLRHNAHNRYASDNWTTRHIDSNGQYRP